MKKNFTAFSKIINSSIRFISVISFFIVIASTKGYTQSNYNTNKYKYLYPVPASQYVSPETNIILKFGDRINAGTISSGNLEVSGSEGGKYNGEFLLSDDGVTLVFNPRSNFQFNEIITVKLFEGIETISGRKIPECEFYFNIIGSQVPQDNKMAEYFNDEGGFPEAMSNISSNNNYLPAPEITVDSLNNPSEGYIFLAAWDRNSPEHLYANFLFILDSRGNIVDSIRVNGAPFDFKVQSNGYLSYSLGDFSGIVPGTDEQLKNYIMDSTFAVVDSFQMKNGYDTDFHEFYYLPNGHAMLMSFHKIPFDMSKVVEGGQENATLVVDIIQEQDRNKNVIFEWRTIDNIEITNSTDSPDSSGVDLTQNRIHNATINGFDLDNDGNILASFRELSQIMKIDRATGEILWRMGGKGKDFNFIDENPEHKPFYFSRQHNVKRLSNGNISIFDNGDKYKYSRAAEYNVDEINGTAALVSEFYYPESLGKIASALAGNAQKLDNGGWFVCYGGLYPSMFSPGRNQIVESHADGSIALSITLPNNILPYRAYKLPWKELVVKPFDFLDNVVEGNNYPDSNHPKNTGIIVHYDSLNNAPYMGANLTRIPYGPKNSVFEGKAPIVYPVSLIYENFGGIEYQKAEFHVDLTKYPEIIHPSNTSFYFRSSEDEEFSKLATTFDSGSNELIAAVRGFGEIAFGEPDVTPSANQPIPFEPEMNSIVSIQDQDSLFLKWTGQGLYDSFRIQVATDTLFNNVILDSTLSSSYITLFNLDSTYYYWRVSSLSNSQNSEWTETWNFKIDFVTGIDNSENTLPLEYNLSQNYPNPFNPETNIKFSIPAAEKVKLEIYDVLGQLVRTLVDQDMQAGIHSVKFNGANLTSGLYLYKLQAGVYTEVKKMMLIK